MSSCWRVFVCVCVRARMPNKLKMTQLQCVSTITTLPQFLTLNLGTSLFFLSFSIWIFLIFLLFRLVHYCLIIFHGFFLFFFLFFVGFLWFWRIARNTTQKVLILLLFYYVPFSTIKKKKENKVLHCSMVHCLCCTMLIKQSLEF